MLLVFHLIPKKKSINSVAKKIFEAYASIGYPLLPITRLIREPMRWYYHKSPLLRHDNKLYLKPYLLQLFHRLFVVEHPQDFLIYKNQVKFRSYGSIMSAQGYYVGEIEYHLVQYIVNQIRPGFVMFDVGSHHGLYTLVVAHELRTHGWEGKIYSFEPDPQNFSLLKYNVEQNGLSDYVVLHSAAITNVDGEQSLLIYKDDNSNNTLKSTSDLLLTKYSKGSVSKDVAVTTLDSFINKVSSVNLIKMDIQGGEPLALMGSRKIIERDQPILVVEAVQEWPTSKQIREFLINQNYSIYGLDANSQLCQFDSSKTFVSWDCIGLPT